MAIAQLWDIAGLSAELNMPRTTLAKRLSGLVPDDNSGKQPKYLIDSVVRHIYLGDLPSPGEAKARLDSLRADEVQLKLEVQRGETVPLSALESVLSRMSNIIISGLNSIPGKVKRISPHLKARDIDLIKKVIAGVANEISETEMREEDFG